MPQVEIKKLQDFPQASFDVTVRSDSVTTHRVTLTKEYYEKLTGSAVSSEALVEASFAFLLAREPNTSILSEFDLQVIKKYFSGYEREMQTNFQAK